MTTIEGIKIETPNQNKILLEETFYVLTKKNCVFRVRLLKKGLSLVKENESHLKEQLIPINDIIGCRCLRSKKPERSCSCQSLPRSTSLKVVEENSVELDDSDASAYLYIYAYLLQKAKGTPNRRERTIITLRFRSFDKFEDNHREAQRWRTAIKKLINGDHVSYSQIIDFSLSHKFKENKRLLVLCNPKSGAGRGKSIFQQKIAPILQEAEIPYDLHITKYANFAREFVRTSNLYQWSGIIVVGGDGVVFEVINGLFERWDWSENVKAIPVGVVPGGSGNGLARSIAYQSGEPYIPSTLPSALAAIKCKVVPMDLVRVETTSQILFSFLSVGWGFISDVDIESERLRILGGQRFNIWSVARLIGLRSYRGKIWYLPANTPMNIPKDVELSPINIGSSPDISTSTDHHATRQRLDSWYSANSRRTAYFSANESTFQSTADHETGDSTSKEKPRMYGPASQLPCLTVALESPWVCVEGKYLMVHASYQSHLSEDCLFVPDAKLNDGLIWLLIIHAGTKRSQLLQFLLGLSTGAHLNFISKHSKIQLLPVKAFRLEPDPSEQGYITVDGELVEYGPIQAEIFPELGRVMVP
ncbi:sphingosine kinase 2-like [Harmonia axyridis]|uniref:sphingosine kinase 2-like n=1 Tax=Harmonia axyridis TaxID=115357 RepID=UPI001E275E71|nr:sphingosine kinase 2-like [Harmonia axyridis]